MGIADGIRFAQAVVEKDMAGYQRDRHSVSGDWVRKNRIFTQLMSDKSIKGQLGRAVLRSIFRIVSMLSGKIGAKKIFDAIAVG